MKLDNFKGYLVKQEEFGYLSFDMHALCMIT